MHWARAQFDESRIFVILIVVMVACMPVKGVLQSGGGRWVEAAWWKDGIAALVAVAAVGWKAMVYSVHVCVTVSGTLSHVQ